MNKISAVTFFILSIASMMLGLFYLDTRSEFSSSSEMKNLIIIIIVAITCIIFSWYLWNKNNSPIDKNNSFNKSSIFDWVYLVIVSWGLTMVVIFTSVIITIFTMGNEAVITLVDFGFPFGIVIIFIVMFPITYRYYEK